MAAKPISVEELDNLLVGLNDQYRSAEELMLDAKNKDVLSSQLTEIDAMFEEYSKANETHVAGLTDGDALKKAFQAYQRELRAYQEFKLHATVWLAKQVQKPTEESPGKLLSTIYRKTSHRSHKSPSVKTRVSSVSSTKRTEAIAIRELARLKVVQLSEKEKLEDKKRQAEQEAEIMKQKAEQEAEIMKQEAEIMKQKAEQEAEIMKQKAQKKAEEIKLSATREIRRLEADHEYQAACIGADAWELVSNSEDYLSLNENEFGLPLPSVTNKDTSLTRSNHNPLLPKVTETNFDFHPVHQNADEESVRLNSRITPDANTNTPRKDESCHFGNCNTAVPTGQEVSLTVENLASAMLDVVNAPKPELIKFYGSYLQFTRFMNSFKINVIDKIHDNAKRLAFLQQYCEGKPRELILHCSMYPPSEGFPLAVKILSEYYGRPLAIAGRFIGELMNGPQLKPDDRDSLLELSNKMEECQLTLSHLKRFSDLDNFDNIVGIACRLPPKYHSRWEDLAADYEARNVDLKFSDLLNFVKNAAKTANSSMHMAMKARKEREKDKQPLRKRIHANSTSTSAKSSEEKTDIAVAGQESLEKKRLTCPVCSKEHLLVNCEEFARQSQTEREASLRKARLCDNCFYRGHIARYCRKTAACGVKGCGEKHHTMLHRNLEKAEQKPPATIKPSTVSGATVANTVRDSAGVYLNIVPVKVSAPGGKEVEVYCFIDEGSTSCLCDRELMDLLQIGGEPARFSITTVNIPEPKPQNGFAIDLTVKSLDGKGCVELPHVLTVDTLPVVPNKLPQKIDIDRHQYLKGLKFPALPDDRVMLMIGVNVPQVFWVMDERRGKPFDPVAKKSILGWSLVGPAFQGTQDASFHVRVHHVQVQDELHQQIKELWETDFKDIALTPAPTMSKEDKYALQLLDDNVKMVNGRYQAPLLWRPGCPDFPNNRTAVMRRTLNLGKRLLKDDGLRTKYCDKMAEFIDKGWARVITKEEMDAPDSVIWYLPHQPVLSEHKPGKVRLVHDCSARYMNTSLNEQLLQGPDFANGMLKVLLNFRFSEYGIMADVQSMFLQVELFPGHCHCLRFLFWPDGDLTKEPVDHQMLVNLFGSSCASFLANYCLKRTAKDFGKDFPADIVKNVENNAYVDDFLLGSSSIEEGKRIVKQTQELVARGGFHLTKWMSNAEEIVSCVSEENKAKPQSEINLDPNQVERVLGVKWFVKEDCFGFDINLSPKPITKRGILSHLSSVFDPMGIVSPVILQARMIFQELCRQKLGWDEKIADGERIAWENWIKAIPDLAAVKLPRCFKPSSFGNIILQELHHFGDASQSGYGVVSYLRMTDDNGQIHCAFLLGRARLCPIKTICSLPRLEITAAALCVKLDMFLRRELDFGTKPIKSVFWSDSTATIQSIYNTTTRFPTFVANRLAKIEEGSTPQQWRYVPSELNPADYASRGMTAKKLVKKKAWLQGSGFLYGDESNWPTMPVKLPDLPPEFTQKRPTKAIVNCVSEEQEKPLDKFIGYYSSWYILKKATAWIIRFVDYICNKRKKIKIVDQEVEELREAERLIIRYVQNKELKNVIAPLQNFV